MVYYEHARLVKNVQKALDKHSALGHRLKSAVMADLATRYDLLFEDSDKHYTYIHECCRRAKTLTELVSKYESMGYNLVFHIMGDMATRHELFFEKEK